MIRKTSHEHGVVDLRHDGEEHVLVHPPSDYDAFIMSQREAVEALRRHNETMSQAMQLRKQIDEMFIDIAGWARKRTSAVAKVAWAPRTDDVLIVVVASDEDPEGTLHNEMADLDLDLSDRYPFRVNFLLLRSSEAPGLQSFIPTDETRAIYDAESRGASQQG